MNLSIIRGVEQINNRDTNLELYLSQSKQITLTITKNNFRVSFGNEKCSALNFNKINFILT